MLFVLQTPSLQHLAGVKIVTCLWTQPDIFALIARALLESYDDVPYKKQKAMEDQVKAKVRALPIHEICKRTLLSFVKPIGADICRWSSYNNVHFNDFYRLENVLPQRLRWTMHGTVNHKKTAELLVKEQRVSVERRYEFACINCLEDEARLLIPLLPENRRRRYANGVRNTQRKRHCHLTTFFTCTLSGDRRRLNRYFDQETLQGESIYIYLFRFMLKRANGAVCEYLFEKLSEREKDEVLEDSPNLKVFCDHFDTCQLLYYLPRMNEEQEERMFRERSFLLLLCLLRWPMRPLFVEAAGRGWGFLDEDKCKDVLQSILQNLADDDDAEYEDCRQLFREGWDLTSVDFKQAFLCDIVA